MDLLQYSSVVDEIGKCKILSMNEKHNHFGNITKLRFVVRYSVIPKFRKKFLQWKNKHISTHYEITINCFINKTGVISDVSNIFVLPISEKNLDLNLKGRHQSDVFKRDGNCSTSVNIQLYKMEKYLSTFIIQMLTNRQLEHEYPTEYEECLRCQDFDLDEIYNSKDLESIDTISRLNLLFCGSDTISDERAKIFKELLADLGDTGKKIKVHDEIMEDENKPDNSFETIEESLIYTEAIEYNKFLEFNKRNKELTLKVTTKLNDFYCNDVSKIITNYVHKKTLSDQEIKNKRKLFWKTVMDKFYDDLDKKTKSKINKFLTK